MKNVLWFVFFIAVCGYADRPRFDNEEDKPEFDNEGYFDYETYKESKKYKDSIYKESIELYKETTEYKEAIERIFGKTRFEVRLGVGVWQAKFGEKDTFGEKSNSGARSQSELGGVAIIPLSKTGPFLFDVELNLIRRGDDVDPHESALSIPLLIQYVLFYKIGSVFEAGIILDFPLYSEAPPDSERDNPFQYRKSIDPGLVLGTGIRMKNFTVGIRIIYYPIFDEFDGSGCAVFNFGVGYLF
jgi:hypothetical protein